MVRAWCLVLGACIETKCYSFALSIHRARTLGPEANVHALSVHTAVVGRATSRAASVFLAPPGVRSRTACLLSFASSRVIVAVAPCEYGASSNSVWPHAAELLLTTTCAAPLGMSTCARGVAASVTGVGGRGGCCWCALPAAVDAVSAAEAVSLACFRCFLLVALDALAAPLTLLTPPTLAAGAAALLNLKCGFGIGYEGYEEEG